jgi:hypothetical protein
VALPEKDSRDARAARAVIPRSLTVRLRDNDREKVVAGPFAAATDLGADAAVLVVGSMPFALLAGGEASCRAGFEHRGKKAEIRRALPRHDTAGCVADIGAVEAESNDAD